MAVQTSSHWGGEWMLGEGKRSVRLNPADGRTEIATSVSLSEDQLDQAIAVTAEGGRKWRRMTIEARCVILRRVGQILNDRSEALGRELSAEQGKVLAEGIGEVRRAAAIFEYYGRLSTQQIAEVYASSEPGQEFRVSYHAVGTIGVVTPWNFPIAIPAWKIAPALAYGNSVVWKPASYVPLLAYRLMEAMVDAGVPAGVVALTIGSGAFGQRIVEHPSIDAVTFTGSTGVGRQLIETCGKLMKPLQAELGGKNVTIVAADANLERAADAIAVGAFSGNGQKCTATSRVVVEASVAEELGRLLKDRVRDSTMGDPLDPRTVVGPVVSEQDQGRIEALLQDVASTRTKNSPSEGWFVAPTVVDLDAPEGVFWRDEIFGPVVAMVQADNFRGALELANDSEFGLAAAVFTNDIRNAHEAQETLEVGMLNLNAPTTGGQPHVPFGGWKNSGFGPREQGAEARAFFARSRTTMQTVL